jgi:hypothetical protein
MNTKAKTNQLLEDIQNKLDEYKKLDPDGLRSFMEAYKVNNNRVIQMSDFFDKRNRRIKPIPLESELLLKRIAEGGHTGGYLAEAFISAYKPGRPFFHGLFENTELDFEAFRIFIEILHIHHSGISFNHLHKIESKIFKWGDCYQKQA